MLKGDRELGLGTDILTPGGDTGDVESDEAGDNEEDDSLEEGRM